MEKGYCPSSKTQNAPVALDGQGKPLQFKVLFDPDTLSHNNASDVYTSDIVLVVFDADGSEEYRTTVDKVVWVSHGRKRPYPAVGAGCQFIKKVKSTIGSNVTLADGCKFQNPLQTWEQQVAQNEGEAEILIDNPLFIQAKARGGKKATLLLAKEMMMEEERERERQEQRELLDMVNQLDMLTGIDQLDFDQNDLADAAKSFTEAEMENPLAAMEEAQRAEFLSAFQACDLDDSGSITILELENALSMAGCANVDQDQLMMAISSIDSDGNGELNYDEFVRLTLMLKSMAANPSANQGVEMSPPFSTMEIEQSTSNPLLT
jgi:Ca2+-binding EF-hand superfamily protein